MPAMPLEPHQVQFNKNVEISVTEPQKKVIEHAIDPRRTLQITSGPGAGKTTTLVYKVAYMIGTLKINPDDILILTMTNRAVDNFKNSLLEIFKNEEVVRSLNVHTFHGFSHKLLTEVDSEYKTKEVLEDSGWNLLNKLIDNKKVTRFNLQKITRDLKRYDEISEEQLKQICSKYSISKVIGDQLIQFFKDLKILTHSDILFNAKQLLKKNPQLLAHKVTIVDEFQDMYDELTELIELVSNDSHLIIAGDPDQSIYGFLGSNASNRETLLSLKDVDTVELDECFRSSPEIIMSANYILSKNSTLFNNNPSGYKPMLNVWETSNDQNESIVLEILRLIEQSSGFIKARDIVILGRTNIELNQIQKALNYYGLKGYKISSQPSWLSGDLFYLIEYLRILISPHDSDFAVLSTMELLPGIGPVAVRKTYHSYLEQDKSVFEVLENEPKCFKYINLINEVMQEMDFNDTKSIFEGLLKLGHDLGLQTKITKTMNDNNDKQRITSQLFEFYENLKISSHLKDLDLNNEGSNLSTAEVFINNYMDLLPYSSTANESIKLSTIHSAKGLEFPIVFMLDMKSMDLKNVEDQRLSYVGMTRAKSLLYLNLVKNNGFMNVHKMKEFDQRVKFYSNDKFFQFNQPVINSSFLKSYQPLKNQTRFFQRGVHTLRKLVR